MNIYLALVCEYVYNFYCTKITVLNTIAQSYQMLNYVYFFSNPSQYISPTHRIDLHSNFSTCSLTAKNYLYVGHILTEKDIELWCFILHPVYKNKQTRKTKTKTCPNSCSLWGSHLTLILPIRLYLLINVFFSSIFFSDLTHL